MTTLAECEIAIRSRFHDWRHEPEQMRRASDELEFADFQIWLERNGYGEELEYLRLTREMHRAEEWFRDEAGLVG